MYSMHCKGEFTDYTHKVEQMLREQFYPIGFQSEKNETTWRDSGMKEPQISSPY